MMTYRPLTLGTHPSTSTSTTLVKPPLESAAFQTPPLPCLLLQQHRHAPRPHLDHLAADTNRPVASLPSRSPNLSRCRLRIVSGPHARCVHTDEGGRWCHDKVYVFLVKGSRKGERQVVGGCEVYAYLYVNGGVSGWR